MSTKTEPALAFRCPICGAKPGEKCERRTGQARTEPHDERAGQEKR